MANLSQCICKFAIDTFRKEFEERPNSNAFAPGISLQLALLIILLGARGKTADQIRKALHAFFLPGADPTSEVPPLMAHCGEPGGLYDQFKKILGPLIDSKVFKTFIGIFLSEKEKLKEGFRDCTSALGAKIEKFDIINSPEKAKDEMNDWIARKTNGQITNVLPPHFVNPSSHLLIVAGFFFKAMWKLPFPPSAVEERPFWTCQGKSVKVKMMVLKGNFKVAYIARPHIKILKLLLDNGLSLFIIIPEKDTPLEQVVYNLNYANFMEWIKALKIVAAVVYFPILNLSFSHSLTSLLKKIGIIDLFLPDKANLSGMSDKPLSVSDIHFAACFKANEEGIEGAGSSRVDFVHDKEVKAHRPFIGVVMDEKSESIVSVLHVCNP